MEATNANVKTARLTIRISRHTLSFSAIDKNTEKQVLENLRKMTDKTVVIVTHRPAALDICDRILEFTENGVIEKNGKKDV